MVPTCLSDEKTLLSGKIERKCHLLFQPGNDEGTQLEFVPLSIPPLRTGEGELDTISRTKEIVRDTAHLQDLKKSSEHQSQLFIIQHEYTWGRLRISQDFFEQFLQTYDISPRFWKCMCAFGERIRENEFGFPAFTCSRSRPETELVSGTYESSYILRRAELHGRGLTDGQPPWSIRQTAIHHKWSLEGGSSKLNPTPTTKQQSTFLLVAPSLTAQKQIWQAVKYGSAAGSEISPWYIHWLLMSESLGGWGDYMAWIEKELKDQTDKILVAIITMKKKSTPQPADFSIEFSDRQNINRLEEYTANLRIILLAMLDNMIQVRNECKKCCSISCQRKCEEELHRDCSYFVDEFDGYAREAKMYIQRAEILSAKVRSTADLLSNLLDYEEARALKRLAIASRYESGLMADLTMKGTRDAAAVKVLTIIGLVYLPTTIVATFFSTTFVHTNDNGNVQVSTQAWILAAVSIPLTLLTVALWWVCVHLNTLSAKPVDEETGIPGDLSEIQLSTFRGRKPSQNVVDHEPGNALNMIGTWSTNATTL